jgi:hypothetical protein
VACPGGDRAARLLAVGIPGLVGAVSVEPVQINGCPAPNHPFEKDSNNDVAVRIDDGLITGLYIVRNPQKLWYLQREGALRRRVRGGPRVDASSTARGSGEPSRSAQFLADGWRRSSSGRDERVKR